MQWCFPFFSMFASWRSFVIANWTMCLFDDDSIVFSIHNSHTFYRLLRAHKHQHKQRYITKVRIFASNQKQSILLKDHQSYSHFESSAFVCVCVYMCVERSIRKQNISLLYWWHSIRKHLVGNEISLISSNWFDRIHTIHGQPLHTWA